MLLQREPNQDAPKATNPTCQNQEGAPLPFSIKVLKSPPNQRMIKPKPIMASNSWLMPALKRPAIKVPRPGVASRLIPAQARAPERPRALRFTPEKIFIDERKGTNAQ